MKLTTLLAFLTDIKDRFDAADAEVYVEGWDDNAYDGDSIEGVRLVIEDDKDGREKSIFIIKRQGR